MRSYYVQVFTYDQIAIMFTGVLACWFSQSRNATLRKWACIFGIAGQPFWFIAAWKANQSGIFIVNFMYAAAWIRGFYNNWIFPWREKQKFKETATRVIKQHDGLFRRLAEHERLERELDARAQRPTDPYPN